ncbi:MAG: tannase/feruloyl esterase family alpha/beta hydrolase, partial [Gammaproteobacteria bacterium]
MFKTALFGGIPWLELPASCRVSAIARPIPGSEIRFEVWMPQAGWNGRVQGVGGGGLAGVIERLSLALAIRRGYAAASTDTGHDADPGDGRWALNRPERIVDYGHRAIHEMTVNAKAVVGAYYGREPDYAYFSGCSNGGRQALMEAQRYPEDYDGIVAGAPALDGTGTLSTWAWNQQVIRAAPDGLALKKKLPLIEGAVLAACDADDGVSDGVVDDPRRCAFDPESLLCAARDGGCLTRSQVDVLKKLSAGPGPLQGYRHFGLEPGGQTGLGGWRDLFDGWFGKSGQYNYVHEFYRYLTYHDPDWSIADFEFAHDRLEMQRRLGPIIDATDPDLSEFVARGGKLILYHGWSDVALPPRITVDYYERVRESLGEAADDAVRLYMAPGMQHCAFGPGPNSFGQILPGGGEAPDRNVHAALEAWVERSEAPQRIVAGKYDGDIRGVIAPDPERLLRTRPLCPYP